MHILLIDDSKDTFALVKASLGNEYDIHWVPSLSEAEKALRASSFDLILLDVMLPDGDGFGYYTKLQSGSAQSTPVIFVTGKAEKSDLVTGLTLGADDYIIKPFHHLELRARVENKVRKNIRHKNAENVLVRGDLKINLETQSAALVTDSGEVRLNLTPIEFKLLNYLAKFEDRVFARDQLIDAVWGHDISVTDRTVDKHVSLLRQKLDTCSYYIETVAGFGYKFNSSHQVRKTG